MLQEELRQMWTPDIPNRSARHSVKDGPTSTANIFRSAMLCHAMPVYPNPFAAAAKS